MLFRLAALAEGHLNCPFVGAAQDVQLERAAVSCLERVEQTVGCANRPARGRYDQVPLCEAGVGGRAVLHYLTDEQALGVGEAHGAPEPPGHVPGSDCNTKHRVAAGCLLNQFLNWQQIVVALVVVMGRSPS